MQVGLDSFLDASGTPWSQDSADLHKKIATRLHLLWGVAQQTFF